MTWRRRRCRITGCRTVCRQTAAGLGDRFVTDDVCIDHHIERCEMAKLEWIDPATLEAIPYQPDSPQAWPCRACGHPRWIHVLADVYWDGACIVPGCDACDGRGDHAPGFVPGRAVAR